MEFQINTGTRYIVSDNAVESRLGDETVLLHLDSGVYFGMDAVGTRVWELLHEGANADGLCETLRREYADAGESLEADILGFLRELIDNKLIHEI
ncbi:MAG: PqqD family protein [Rhodobacteraceae bacterium]|nr:MAG: PqqD family protein [Paracoccaceae bacterium]